MPNNAIPRWLDKRTFDSRLFDIDCSALLGPNEVMTSVLSQTDDQTQLTFTGPVINPAPIVYPQYNRTAPVGTVIQVTISGGQIPAGAPEFFCTIRTRFATNINPLGIEATHKLRLCDTP